jgi:hypothetical protein
LKIHDKKMSATSFPLFMKMVGSAVASCSLLLFGTVAADAASIGGDSTSILRIRETTSDRSLVPVYEYLHLTASDDEPAGNVSLHLGGWGRIDWGDRSTSRSSNGDVQYGFVNFRGAKNNLNAQAGRQYINEGVTTDHVDGLYLRSDLAMRFTAAGFIGSPATETTDGFRGGDLIFGGRVAHTVPSLYSIGVSMVQTNDGSSHLRQEEGVDLWLHPLKQIDIAGRSVYNSLTNHWNEHDYTATITPFAPLRISASISNFDYRHYFHHVTTSALSVRAGGALDPREELTAAGGTVGFTVMKNLNVSGDYKHYNYEIRDDADYYGGGITYSIPDNMSAGVSYHRMDGGGGQRNRYNEYRVYASKKFGRSDLTLDFWDDALDASINRTKNTYSFSAVAGHDFSRDLRVAADLEYLQSIDFDNDLRGLIKVVYAFGSERRGK